VPLVASLEFLQQVALLWCGTPASILVLAYQEVFRDGWHSDNGLWKYPGPGLKDHYLGVFVAFNCPQKQISPALEAVLPDSSYPGGRFNLDSANGLTIGKDSWD